jgi:hypothetical protein
MKQDELGWSVTRCCSNASPPVCVSCCESKSHGNQECHGSGIPQPWQSPIPEPWYTCNIDMYRAPRHSKRSQHRTPVYHSSG